MPKNEIPGVGKPFNEEIGSEFAPNPQGFPDPRFGMEQWANHKNADSNSDELDLDQ
jgi:hypothetical protein